MSIDWKARCTEHCGTIGKRDATIAELQAQLDASLPLIAELGLRVKAALRREKKLEAQLKRKTLALETCLGNCNTHELNEAEAIEKNLELQAQLDAVRGCINGRSQLRVDVSRIMKALEQKEKE